MGWKEFFFGDTAKKTTGRFQSVDWSGIDGRWATVEAMAASSDQVQKKQAIIQADMLIDAIMKEAGVAGTTMGDRLKNLNGKLSREILNGLWGAHKKRNELVHEHGSHVEGWEVQQYLAAFKAAVSQMRGLK